MQYSLLQTLTFTYFCNTSQLICKMLKSLRRYCKHKQKSVFRIGCCALVKVVLLRRSKNSISKSTIPLSSFARFSLNLQYLRGENGQTNYKTSAKNFGGVRPGNEGTTRGPRQTEFGWPRPSGRDNVKRLNIT